MIGLLWLALGSAEATSSSIGVAADAHTSLGMKTQIGVTGLGFSGFFHYQGRGQSGVQVEVQDLWMKSPSGAVHLPGARAGWSRQWRDLGEGRRIYSVCGLGGYANEVLPVACR